MKFASAVFLCFLFSVPAFLQTKPLLHLDAEFKFDASQADKIAGYKLNDDDNTLTLVGQQTVRRLNLVTETLSAPVRVDVPESKEDHSREVSPDGRWLLVFGNYGSHDKVKHPASIWNIESGKQVAVLDKTKKPVRSGFWSKNGKTLVTSSDKYAPYAYSDNSVEVSFWDGEAFTYQNSLPSDKVNWFYLTNDGTRCFYTIGRGKNVLFISKFILFGGGPINVWDTKSGKANAALKFGNPDDKREISEISISPDEQRLALVFQYSNSKQPTSSLIIRDIGEDNHSGHDLAFPVEAKVSGLSFSSNGRSIAVYKNKDLQIFDVDTGALKKELIALKAGSLHWLANDQTLLIDYNYGMTALDIAKDHTIYDRRLVYIEYTNYDSDGSYAGETIEDSTDLVMNRQQDLILAFSKQSVEIIDSTTGQRVQRLVSPPPDPIGKKRRWTVNRLVLAAGWAGNGKSIFELNADGNTISLWRPAGN